MNTKITFYRLENDQGIGPFKENAVYLFPHCDRLIQKHNNLPTPQSEGLYMDTEYYCGFPTKRAISKWFSKGELATLLDNGYTLYKCTGIANKGKYQVTFKKQDLTSKIKCA